MIKNDDEGDGDDYDDEVAIWRNGNLPPYNDDDCDIYPYNLLS